MRASLRTLRIKTDTMALKHGAPIDLKIQKDGYRITNEDGSVYKSSLGTANEISWWLDGFFSAMRSEKEKGGRP